ncbi:AAA family ATPase [Gilvimarinus sp. SDUM040013]|uniref:AAA family ATPase n=1 Tax=Gilvimarinus gilvus TaxID=3058038 RepID=A0ABU4RSU0_9GAMM|nr:AAA family ATPase [Gilvimarinus sp. SDUM040013]MDO3388179.1 AAA family ATPase [Gilvimarinus sp. SDUM040013]MDX6847729.1 AAA family ATPase [Gilvimarinus sp. SDUM040013]
MYGQHFGLGEQPFSLTPDTQFFYDNQSHREALGTIMLALRHSEGFVKVVGEVGTGKTLLGRKLLDQLDRKCLTAYIPNPYLTPDELKWFLAEEIGVATENKPAHKLLNDINQKLVELAGEKRQVVLVVDEAQAMPRETLEALRLLTNLETRKRKLLQVVLMGQPELDDMLERSDLRQLKQRIVFSEYLHGIAPNNIQAYVDSRLRAAGYTGAPLFTRGAIRLLRKASGGTPRLINVLCHKAMMAAYGEGDRQIQRQHMARAVLDTSESRPAGKRAAQGYWWWLALGVAAALIGVSGYAILGGSL